MSSPLFKLKASLVIKEKKAGGYLADFVALPFLVFDIIL